MKNHIEFGRKGEELAKHFLQNKGYTILSSNWRSGKWEIDIVAEFNNVLVIVEVKTRKNKKFGNPEDKVSLAKQQHLTNAANVLIETLEHKGEVRFDIISIINNKSEYEIHHIEDAFFSYQK